MTKAEMKRLFAGQRGSLARCARDLGKAHCTIHAWLRDNCPSSALDVAIPEWVRNNEWRAR